MWSSLLADHSGPMDDAWLQQEVSAGEFFAPFSRHSATYIHPAIRAALEAQIAADRAAVEAALEPGDQLRPWRHQPYQDGCVGLAVIRSGKVVRSWLTAQLV